ncbi:hypothetical protein B4117_4708 [Bacillus mycoides]|nr:hypothetical protein B4117_4708 [Bacillus mycoides]
MEVNKIKDANQTINRLKSLNPTITILNNEIKKEYQMDEFNPYL